MLENEKLDVVALDSTRIIGQADSCRMPLDATINGFSPIGRRFQGLGAGSTGPGLDSRQRRVEQMKNNLLSSQGSRQGAVLIRHGVLARPGSAH